MSLTDNGIRSLEGPFTHHVYIGFSPKDRNTIYKLCGELQNLGVICYLRPVKDDVKSSIQEGIRVSQRCLLFLSPDYLADDWFQFESEVVLEKVDRFCRDTLIIMKSGPSVEVPKKLCGFKEILFDSKKIKDEKANARLADIITTGMTAIKSCFSLFHITIQINENFIRSSYSFATSSFVLIVPVLFQVLVLPLLWKADARLTVC